MEGSNNNQSATNSNLKAAVCYLWIVSIVMLVRYRQDAFVQFHARQGAVLFVISAAAMLFSSVLFFISAPVCFVVIVLEVVGFFKALGGDRYELPIIGALAKQIKL